MKLLLASSSPYRKNLLQRLRLDFQQDSPDIDETPRLGESAKALAMRLSRSKAEALCDAYPDTLIIASDQAASLDHQILGKPGTEEKAIEQLLACSGKTVIFHTGLCLLNTRTGQQQLDCIDFSVTFRSLSEQQITRYIHLEQPLDCAGSFKCEGLGIALFERMRGEDPNSLVGLPLIRLTSMLNNEGIDILS